MKKGFTLVEVLAIIIILGIIAAITVPAVKESIRSSKQRLYNVAVSELEKAAKKYVVEYGSSISGLSENGIGYILLSDLASQNLISNNVQNPITGDPFDLSSAIRVGLLYSGAYQFDFFIDGEPPLLTTMFSPGSAGANGTYASKNGSNYFIGQEPNNWLEFGQVSSEDDTPLLWRIIKNDDDGIKIIYDGVSDGATYRMEDYGMITIDSVSLIPWDETNSNKWLRPASLNTKLLDWYDDLYIVDKEILVKPIQWCIGAVPWGGPTTIAEFLAGECSDTSSFGGDFVGLTDYESAVGLINPSDYMSTSSAATCTVSWDDTTTADEECGHTDEWVKTNFLYKYYDYWTFNAISTHPADVWDIGGDGAVSSLPADYTGPYLIYVRPVLNLKSVVRHDSGDGTFANPYKIK